MASGGRSSASDYPDLRRATTPPLDWLELTLSVIIMPVRVELDAAALIEELRTWNPMEADGIPAQDRIGQLDQVRGARTTLA